MSIPSEPEDVKRIVSLISGERGIVDGVLRELEAGFGPADWKSPLIPFDRTRYYEREMGAPLVRRFASFQRLMRPEEIVGDKLETNRLEARRREDGRRTVNIDPGYVSLERLVLATGKNYTHRIYLSHGVYADLTLVFHRQTFRSLPWTYPDYGDPAAIQMFNEVRARYKMQLRGVVPPEEGVSS
jgi:hypothetical protein